MEQKQEAQRTTYRAPEYNVQNDQDSHFCMTRKHKFGI